MWDDIPPQYGYFNGFALPPTSAPEPTPSNDIWGTIKSGANSLLSVWSDVNRANATANQMRIAGEVQKAQAEADRNRTLSGLRVGTAYVQAQESVELARASAIARNTAPGNSLSQFMPLILLAGVGLLAFKLAK